MNENECLVGVCLVDADALELEQFALACGTGVDFIHALIDEGLLQPLPQPQPQPPASSEAGWRFGGEELSRVRRIRRLQRDFDANLQSVAVMLDLLDQIESLRARLRRAGL